MKQKIDNVLEETGYKESRASKMDINDILKYVRSSPCVVFSYDSLADYYWLSMILTSILPDCSVVWCHAFIVSTIIYLD